MKPLAVVGLALLVSDGARQVEVEPHSSEPAPNLHFIAGAARCQQYQAELQPVSAGFRAVDVPSEPGGWNTAREAALAFYEFHDDAYQATDDTSELVGFLLRSAQGRHFFTNAAEVPFAFRLTASIARPFDWTVDSMLHTHPAGRACQEEFSIEDRDTVLRGTVRSSYLRTPSGNVLFLDRHLADVTSTRWGATGLSVCPHDAPCLTMHEKAQDEVRYASR